MKLLLVVMFVGRDLTTRLHWVLKAPDQRTLNRLGGFTLLSQASAAVMHR